MLTLVMCRIDNDLKTINGGVPNTADPETLGIIAIMRKIFAPANVLMEPVKDGAVISFSGGAG